MNVEDIREYCLSLKGVTEAFPFDDETLVFKVMGKMFCLCSLNGVPVSCNLKCEPERAVELRETYSGVRPGYHMNKKHWNTVVFDGSFPDALAREWIMDSYRLVVAGLPARLKQELNNR